MCLTSKYSIFYSWFKPFTHTANQQQTTLKSSTKKYGHLYNCRYNYYEKFKTLWQKEKLLASSNFSYCHNVFKSRLLQVRHNASIDRRGLSPKGLIDSESVFVCYRLMDVNFTFSQQNFIPEQISLEAQLYPLEW